MNKIFCFVLCSLLILVGTAGSVVSFEPGSITIIYVDDDNTEGPWDGTQHHPFRLIQDAIDRAEPGYTILVSEGLYSESIVLDKQVSLIGSSFVSTIIDGMQNNSTVHIKSDYCRLKGFQIMNCSFNPLEFQQSLLMIDANDTCVEENCFSMRATDDFFSIAAVQINQGDHNSLVSNIFVSEQNNSRNHAIYLNGECEQTVIQLNTISGFDVGYIDSIDCLDTRILENNLAENLFGIDLYGSQTIIQDNNISDNRADGIIVYKGTGHYIVNNTFQNNGCNEGYGAAPAIKLSDGSGQTCIENNDFIHNAGPGIYVYMSYDNRITQNNFIDNGWNYQTDYKPNAFFYTHIMRIGKTNQWNKNYWYPSESSSLEKIPAVLRFFTYFDYVCSISWATFDFFPVDTPYP